jgi:hypothetical protein
MTDLVPEPNPSQQRVRECERGCVWQGAKFFFLSYGGRLSCATPPGPRALCEVGLAAWFLFLAVHFSPGCSVPAPHSSLQRVTREGGCGRRQKLFCLAAAARAAPRPQDRARCVRWGLRRGLYFVRSVLVRAIGPQRHISSCRECERERGRGQKLFLARGCRPSRATPPGPRAPRAL